MNETRALSQEIEAVRILVDQIRAACPNDDALLSDMIEGETSLFELIAKVDASEVEDQATVIGIDAMVEKLEARKRRVTAAIETKRALLANGLDLAGKKTHRTALGTITLSAAPIVAVVTDESMIPARFWRQPEPVLDKKALNVAVKDGESVPGVEKSNGGVKITIRRG